MDGNGDFEPLDTSRFPKTMRVTFEVGARGVRVRSNEHVEMIAPASPAPIPENGAGTWVELRSGEEEILFARGLQNPFYRFAEHPSSDGSIEPFQRRVERSQVEVLLPLMDEATHGRLILGEDAGLRPHQPPLTFDLEEKPPPPFDLERPRRDDEGRPS